MIGLRFSTVNDPRPLPVIIGEAIARFGCKFDLPPTHLVFKTANGQPEIAGLIVIEDGSLQPKDFELRTTLDHGDCVCMQCHTVYNHIEDMRGVSHGYCSGCAPAVLAAVEAVKVREARVGQLAMF